MAKAPKSAQGGGKQAGSPRGFLVAMIILTALAGASGFFFTKLVLLAGETEQKTAAKPSEPDKAHGAGMEAHKDGHKDGAEVIAKGKVVLLAPIVTNLGSPNETFVRIESSLVVDPEYTEKDIAHAKVSEDIIMFLRTVSLSEIQGTMGLAHLRDDLNDRVRIRTEGRARELIINSLVVE